MIIKPSKGIIPILFCIILLFYCVIPAIADTKESKKTSETTELFHLNEIVVTGTKTPYQLKDVPVQTDVITDKDIENMSVQTVSDILKSIPGFFTVSEDIPGETSWRASLRGLDINAGYSLVLINGQRVKGEGMGEYGFGVNQVPISLIEKIEVIKGPASVLYGSDALTGVVNIITKPCPDEPIYGAEIATGSQNTKMASAYAGTKEGALGAYIHASINEADIGAYGYKSSRDEKYHVNRIDTQISYEFSEKLDGTVQLAAEDKDRSRQYKTKDITRNTWYKKYRIAPKVNYTIDDTSQIKISGYYFDWNLDSMETGEDSSGYSASIGNMYYRDVEARYTKHFKDKFQLSMGYEFLQEELDYTFSEKTIDTNSGYAQIETDFSDSLILVLGARYDDHSVYGGHFSPKASFMYRPFEDTMIRGSVGKGFKSPTIRQLHYTDLYQHGDYWYQSNSELDPETAIGYSLGVEQILKNRLIVECSLFRNDIEDKVLNVETGLYEEELPIVSYENVSKAYTQGIELGFKALISKGLTGTLAYSFTDTEDEDSGNELTYIPTNTVTAGLVYKYAPFGISFSTNVQYVDEMYTNSDNTKDTNDYTLVDAKLVKTFGDSCSISIEGNNLFDSDYGQPDREWLNETYLVKFKMDI